MRNGGRSASAPTATRRPAARRIRWTGVVAGAAGIGAAALAGWAFWPDSDPDPRARLYRDVTACLLTPAAGVADPEAASVWAGMQDASARTLAKVQYLEVEGPQTAENARSFLATLASSRCDIVLTVGKAANDALAGTAPRYPDVAFVRIGGGTSLNNVSVVDPSAPDAVRAAVGALLTERFPG